MQYLGLFFTIAFLTLNLWGGALATGFFVRNRFLALVLAPWLWTSILYCGETFHGLGDLRWLGLITTLSSATLIALSANWNPGRFFQQNQTRLEAWRAVFAPRKFWPALAIFGGIFCYGLLWRLAFPSIDGSSEKIPDLMYICSYLPGQGVPAKDAWLSPYVSVHYYSFQYYAAALLGRMLGLAPGYTYNVAFAVIVGLTGAAFAGATTVVAKTMRVRCALLAVFLFGGTGVSGIVHLFYKEPTLWSGMRFIGSAPYDKAPIGVRFQEYANHFKRLELPGEPFSYSIFLGDYHPPLSGFYLLCVAILAGGLYEVTQQKRFIAIVGATLTWNLLSNTWTLPLQGAVIGLWCLWHWRKADRFVPLLAVGAGMIWLLALGYLNPFIAASAEYKTAFRLVSSGDHTPAISFFLYLLPTIGIGIAALCSGRRVGWYIGIGVVAALLFSEFVYVDDVYSGEFERFNTTLKWWPWIASATVLLAGPILLEQSRRKSVRLVGWLLCLYPCLYVYDLSAQWIRAPKPEFGELQGSRYLTQDEGNRRLIDRLKAEPKGLVIERLNKDSYTNTACLPLFAGDHLWLGWFGHEQLWHGYAGDIAQRQDRLMNFFNGDMAEAPGWLVSEKIDYILWYQPADSKELWTKISEAIRADYIWCDVLTAPDGRRIGFWRRR